MNNHKIRGWLAGWSGVAFLCSLAASQSFAFYDGFESYTNGSMFVLETNGWQASVDLVQVQTNEVPAGEGTNAVVMPNISVFTNTVQPENRSASLVWTDYRIRPPLGSPPDVGAVQSGGDSVRLYFDLSGYVAVDSNRTWVVCSDNVFGNPAATLISNQWIRVSVCVDYARSNAAVFVDGELLRHRLPLPGSVATNYNRVFWSIEASTGYLDSVSITNVWPAFATNSVTDLDNDGMLDAQEIQVYGNLTTYHRPNLHVAITNLTLGGASGGSVLPPTNADFTVMPGSSTNFMISASPGYHVAEVFTNGGAVGPALVGRNTGAASFDFGPIWTDTTVLVEFATNLLVSSSAGTGGTITPAAVLEVYPGTNLAYAVTAFPAYVVSSITTNGASVGDFTGKDTRFAAYTVSDVQSNLTLVAQFTYTSNRTVGATGDYATIGDAVSAALGGDTIQVQDGSYPLTAPVVITNRLTLTGNIASLGQVAVIAPSGGADMDCFQVRTNGVTIEGFLMTGATNGTAGAAGAINAGIMVGNDTASNQMAAVRVLTNLGNEVFRYNVFSNCSHGVYVWGATNCLVAQSEFVGNTTGVWARLTTDARSNWWGAASGPGPVGPGTGDLISSNVLVMPWWVDAARTARVIYDAGGLQAELDLAQNGDVIWTTNGTFAGDIHIDKTVRFLTDLSLQGMITFNASLASAVDIGCTNARVADGVTVSLTGSTLTATNLVIQGSGLVVGSGDALLSADGYSLSGEFTADCYWATLVPSTLDFFDSFEAYETGTRLSALGLYGWSALASTVEVQTNVSVTPGTHAVILPPETEANNTLTSSTGRIWTDYRWLPILGDLPAEAATSNQSIRISFTRDGWLALDTTNGWIVCSNDVVGGVAPKASNDWVRISVFQDYVAGQQAVFLNNVLLREQQAFVGNHAAAYTQLRHLNTGTESNLFLDAVSIGRGIPAGLTGDLTHDGIPDAAQIHRWGSVFYYCSGSIFTIR